MSNATTTRVTCRGCGVQADRLPDGDLVAVTAMPATCLPQGILHPHGPWTDEPPVRLVTW